MPAPVTLLGRVGNFGQKAAMTAAFLSGADASTDVPLALRLKRADRKRQAKALALVLPLLLFLLFTFVGPIAGMLWRSVDD